MIALNLQETKQTNIVTTTVILKSLKMDGWMKMQLGCFFSPLPWCRLLGAVPAPAWCTHGLCGLDQCDLNKKTTEKSVTWSQSVETITCIYRKQQLIKINIKLSKTEGCFKVFEYTLKLTIMFKLLYHMCKLLTRLQMNTLLAFPGRPWCKDSILFQKKRKRKTKCFINVSHRFLVIETSRSLLAKNIQQKLVLLTAEAW